ncbi:MAG: uridine kinase [Myxococcota bacterium]|jgi:uridine kinase|nr:uridine kinase [Myxococcota bacterium]OQC40719.1 MAG: Uridine kinase [Deltaproteobacteria bacterium ADurb.Bin058]HHW97286.1 uridine kinase [Oligoflexales bacterium]MBP8972051.1 uridine kinase [Myxococcota bacterium]HOE83493.1 uridine kinase [Myxococcota bacterium]
MNKSQVIGIAGGTGSGKSTVADRIVSHLGADSVVIIYQDNYYLDLTHLSIEERAQWNFDHPDAVDAKLMAKHIAELKAGRAIDMPVYDFKTHTRLPDQTIRVEPKPTIIVEGILVLAIKALRSQMDVKLYVETDDDLRLIRRLKRDINERGRTVESVIEQYEKTVRPMHLAFVETSRRFADVIIPWAEYNDVGVEVLINSILGVRARKAGA